MFKQARLDFLLCIQAHIPVFFFSISVLWSLGVKCFLPPVLGTGSSSVLEGLTLPIIETISSFALTSFAFCYKLVQVLSHTGLHIPTPVL